MSKNPKLTLHIIPAEDGWNFVFTRGSVFTVVATGFKPAAATAEWNPEISAASGTEAIKIYPGTDPLAAQAAAQSRGWTYLADVPEKVADALKPPAE